ncbi:MAG TPA: hypothetical protein DGG95_11425 [Cytophagales bacterium]|nr:hypothetical protein [Cytophagales bacterium]
MRLILVLMFSSGQLFCKADPSVCLYDTIPNRQILYGDKLIIKGNIHGQIEKIIDTVFYKPGTKYLTIFYNYDAADPGNKEIEIWNDRNLVFKEAFNKKPFKIELWDILSGKTNGKVVDLEIYYADDSMKKKRSIGQLTFFFPYRPHGRPSYYKQD